MNSNKDNPTVYVLASNFGMFNAYIKGKDAESVNYVYIIGADFLKGKTKGKIVRYANYYERWDLTAIEEDITRVQMDWSEVQIIDDSLQNEEDDGSIDYGNVE